MKKINLRIRNKLFHMNPHNKVRVYTYQHVDAYSVAKENGFFTGDHPHRYIDYHKAYTWIKDQMSVNIPNFSGEYPIWAYAKKPNLRHDPIEKDQLLITALVPRNRILFSDYMKWHHPLNDWPIYNDDNEEKLAGENQDPVDTWYRCLEITNAPSEEWGVCSYIQACVDRIYMSEIVSITRSRRR